MAKSPKMTAKRRRTLKPSSFGLPAKRAYPIDTPGRARAALGRAKTNATPAQQATIKRAVKRKYPSIKISGTTSRKRTGK